MFETNAATILKIATGIVRAYIYICIYIISMQIVLCEQVRFVHDRLALSCMKKKSYQVITNRKSLVAIRYCLY